MTLYLMNMIRRVLVPGERHSLTKGHHAFFALSGSVGLNGQHVGAGVGIYAHEGEIECVDDAEILDFHLSARAENGADMSKQFEWLEAEAVFRLDQVGFPPGACAYRHTHPGPGIRCLIEGSLEIRSDHHVQTMTPLSTWFEAADSPVKATAGDVHTAFVRAMVLPLEFLGKPTLNILDPADAAKPRLQTNQRFVDQVVRLRSD